MKYPMVVSAVPQENYSVVITFETGETKKFCVEPYIEGEWYGQLRDIAVFNTVRPCGNTIEWEGGQDIAPHELYEMSVSV